MLSLFFLYYHYYFFLPSFASFLSLLVMFDSLQPHELYPARLLCPWNCPGKNGEVSHHNGLGMLGLDTKEDLRTYSVMSDSLPPHGL